MKMAGDSKQNLKLLRVDNWAVFFLQRLQLLFAKGDCCDLTLKFVTGQELKVHRLVLSTSTSFFESMESTDNVINLPDTLPYSVVQPIINFLYSGRLEFKAELHSQLLAIAKIMKLAILARILVAQKNENGVGDHIAATPTGKVVDIKKVQLKTASSNKTPTSSSYVNIVAGKKLPIWKKRTVPYKFDRKPIKEEEPRPTRFEWPDEETCTNLLMASPSFTSLSYESAPVISPSVTSRTPSPHELPSTSLKRRVMPPINSIPDKIFKADGNILNATENEAKNNTDNQLSSNDTNVNLSDDDDDGHFETIHTYGDSDDEDPEDIPSETESPANNLKPILKPMTDSPVQTPGKKVRFSLTPEDKENKDEKTPENVNTPKGQIIDNKEISNHAKIIQEVLKKYPDLVKHNKNIKLKITTPGSGSKQSTITIDTKKMTVLTKPSSYIVKTPKKESALPSASDTTEKPAGNNISLGKTVGSWKCESCLNENEQLKFESYSEYKKHLQEAHAKKTDSKICEYCGYKASKRNLHLYHLYTKHGVDPPANVKFPKCSQCAYIALSESLLVKHLNSHQMAKDLTCQVCNATFKTYSVLHVHSLSCKPNSEVRSYSCLNCKKIFKTNVSLNAHLKECSVPQDESVKDEDQSETSNDNNVIEVPIIETVDMNKGEHALVQIPSGIILTETPNVALLPSSESEALNNVASSIATSIGLTVAIPQEHQSAVILLDDSTQFFLQENGSVVVANNSDVEEYIVPELLRDEMGQIYTTQNVPYTVASTGVITCPVITTQSEHEIDKNKESECASSSTSTTLNLNKGDHNYAEGDSKEENEMDRQEILLESADSHLESSNTRVAIKDSQAEDLDVVELERALRSPEQPLENPADDTGIEVAPLNNNNNNDAVESTEKNLDDVPICSESVENVIIADMTTEYPKHDEIQNIEENIEDKTQSEEKDETQKVDEIINIEKDNEENLVKDEASNDECLEKNETNESDKAISLVRDWGFDNEEDTEEDIDAESEIRPSRPTVDF